MLLFAGQPPQSRPRDKFARRSHVWTLVEIKIARLHMVAPHSGRWRNTTSREASIARTEPLFANARYNALEKVYHDRWDLQ